MRRTTVLLSAGLIALDRWRGVGAKRQPAQPDPVRAGRPARAHRDAADRACDGRAARQGRQFQEFALAVSDLHHRQRSAMATGHYLGDTGDFSNTIYTGYPVAHANDTVTPFLEVNPVLARCRRAFRRRLPERGNHPEDGAREGLQHRGHRQARPYPDLRPYRQDRRGGPAFDRDRRRDRRQERRSAVGRNEGRADQGQPSAGDARRAATTARPATPRRRAPRSPMSRSRPTWPTSPAKVVLPMFKARNKPFVLVFWSRDPDGSQHNTGDSLNTITPGINGPTSMAGIKNADNNLAQLRKALDDLGLAASTNIMVSSDHGFSTISKESKTSPSAKISYDDTPKDFLPDGLRRHRSGEGAGPAAVRPQRQERTRRRQCPSQGRQRPARQGSRKARYGRRHQWRIGPDLYSEQGTQARWTAPSRRCWNRIMSAASSSMTSSGVSRARCRCRNSASRARR